MNITDIEILVPILAVWVVFDLCRSVWDWVKKEKPKPPAPVILPEDYWLKIKQMIDSGCLDAMIAVQEAQGYTPEATTPVAPVATTPAGNNGHSDEDIESATALYHASRALNEQAEERAESPNEAYFSGVRSSIGYSEPAEEVQHVPVKDRHTDPPLVRKRGRPFGSKGKKKEANGK